MSGADLPASLGAPPQGEKSPPDRDDEESGAFARLAARITALSERWIPDAFVFALIATFVVVIAGFALLVSRGAKAGHAARVVVDAWGGGFWSLVSFTMQMSLVIITGYVLATARPIYRAIASLAAVPKSPRVAIAMVALFAMTSSWLNWGFSLIFSAMLAKEVARRVSGVDYRAVAASSFLGLGSIWAQGLSGSAALQMATGSALDEATRKIVAHDGVVPGGLIPLSRTIFLWQSLVSVAIEIVVVTAVVYLAAPSAARARTAQSMGVDLGPSPLERVDPPSRNTPSEWFEHRPFLNVAFVVVSLAYLVSYFARAKHPLDAISLDAINLVFLTLGVALHGTPARLMRAVKEATPGVWGVILQFPLYAGIAATIKATGVSELLAHSFAKIASAKTYPALIAVYSAILGVFVPSGGSKWVIEAPYVMQASHDLRVNLGWMVACYDLGEALANLVQPFWMLPILGLFGLRARDVMGYTFLVFVVLAPLVLVLVTMFGATLSYP